MVQGLLSLQVSEVPLQVPALQTSLAVHALLSSHTAVLLVKVQLPVDDEQVSVVHGLLSLHTLGLPARQPPFWHT